MDVSSQSLKLANIYDGNCNKKKTDLIEMILYGCTANKLNKKRLGDISLTLLCMGRGGGEFTPFPCRNFFNNFFFTQAKSLKFSDFNFLSFRQNVAKLIKKY